MDMKKNPGSEVSQIILDAEISLALQANLIKENLARLQREDWIAHEAIKRGLKNSHRALEYLLLYERVLIPARGCLADLTEGVSEFCTIIPDDSRWWKRAEWKSWLLEYFQQILELSGQIHRHYDPDPAKVSVFNAFTKKDISFLNSIRSFLLPYLRTRPSKLVLPVSSIMFDSVIEIINKESESSGMHLWSNIGKDPPTNKFADKFAWELKLYAHRIFEELKELEWLMAKSATLGVPVATPRVRIPRDKALNNCIIRSDSDYWQAYQIYLDEVEIFPELRSVNDVLRLRQRPEVKRLREHLSEWSTQLRDGNRDAEKEMRHQIRRATHELKHLGTMRKVGWWSTVMSLPVGIVELLVGSPSVGGLVLAALGTSSLVRSKRIKKQHSWLLIGN